MSHDVECLSCGTVRLARFGGERTGEQGECPECGYLGWATPGALSEGERRIILMRPPERRRLYAV